MNEICEVKKVQLIWIILIIFPGGKYLALPALLARIAWHDSWLALLGLFIIDFVCFFCMLIAININNKGLSINDILTKTLTKVGAIIIYVLIGLLFLLRLMTLFMAVLELLGSTLMIKTTWLAFVVPLMLVISFAVKRGIKNIARVTQLLGTFILIALLSIMILSLSKVNMEFFSPVLEFGLDPIIVAMNRHTFWFSDALFLVFLINKIEKGKCFKLSMSLGFWGGVILTIAMDMVFIGLFGPTSWLQKSAIANVSQFNIMITTNGRYDWLNLIVWMISLLIKGGILLFCVEESIKNIFNIKNKALPWWGYFLIGIPLFVVPFVIPFEHVLYEYIRDIKIFWIVQYLLPIALPILTYIANKKAKVKKGNLFKPLSKNEINIERVNYVKE